MRGIVVVIALLLLALAGCEEDVVLVDETERAFTLYGVLNPQRDTQFVHVFPIEGKLEPPAQSLAARLMTTDLQTGEVQTWSDSLIQDHDGHNAHVFWRLGRPAYGHAYRLVAEASDGHASEVEVDVPPHVRPRLGEPSLAQGYVLSPVVLEGEAPRLVKVEATFWGRTVERYEGPMPVYVFKEVSLPYDDRPEKAPGGWIVPVNLTQARRMLYDAFASGLPRDTLNRHGIDLLLITLKLIVASEDWNPPGGTFDPEAMAHPSVMTNVENGFGFVGAGYWIRHQWRPKAEVLEAAGFVPPR